MVSYEYGAVCIIAFIFITLYNQLNIGGNFLESNSNQCKGVIILPCYYCHSQGTHLARTGKYFCVYLSPALALGSYYGHFLLISFRYYYGHFQTKVWKFGAFSGIFRNTMEHTDRLTDFFNHVSRIYQVPNFMSNLILF